MSLTKFVGLLAGSTLTLTGVSYGAAEANNDTTAQINQLKAEIASLKAAQGDQWLTEQRAEQIRGVVQDVLADSSTRSSFQGAAATSGYDNGFFLSSADGNFKLKINALEQVRFTWGNGYGAATAVYTVSLVPGTQVPNTTVPVSGRVNRNQTITLERGNRSGTNANPDISWRVTEGRNVCQLRFPANGTVNLRTVRSGTCTVRGTAPAVAGQWNRMVINRTYRVR